MKTCDRIIHQDRHLPWLVPRLHWWEWCSGVPLHQYLRRCVACDERHPPRFSWPWCSSSCCSRCFVCFLSREKSLVHSWSTLSVGSDGEQSDQCCFACCQLSWLWEDERKEEPGQQGKQRYKKNMNHFFFKEALMQEKLLPEVSNKKQLTCYFFKLWVVEVILAVADIGTKGLTRGNITFRGFNCNWRRYMTHLQILHSFSW